MDGILLVQEYKEVHTLDFDNLGYGAGGGIISAILVALGFKSRMDKLDRDMTVFKKTVRYTDTCEATHKPIDTTLERIEGKLDKLLMRRRSDRENEET